MSLFQRISSKAVRRIYFISSLLGFLAIIPLFLTLTSLFVSPDPGLKSLGSTLLRDFVIAAIIYFILSFLLLRFASKLAARWFCAFFGVTTGVGLVYFVTIFLQILVLSALLNIKTQDIAGGEGAGLGLLAIFLPAGWLVLGGPFIALMLGTIGYLLGKREETIQQLYQTQNKQVQFDEVGEAKIKVVERSTLSYVFEPLGFFVLGPLVIFPLFLNYFAEPYRLLAKRFHDNTFLAIFSQYYFIFALLPAVFLGFYSARFVMHKINKSLPNVSRNYTVVAVILVLVFVIFPLGVNTFWSFYNKTTSTLFNKISLTAFKEKAIYNQALDQRDLEITAKLFVPLEGVYEIKTDLVDLDKKYDAQEQYRQSLSFNLPISLIVDSKKIENSVSQVHLEKGERRIVLVITFSSLFEEKISANQIFQRDRLKETIHNNSLGVRLTICTLPQKGDPEEQRNCFYPTAYNLNSQDLVAIGF